MADDYDAENLEDGEQWLPSNFFSMVDKAQVSNKMSSPLDFPHFSSSICQPPYPGLYKPFPTLQRFKPAVWYGSTDVSGAGDYDLCDYELCDWKMENSLKGCQLPHSNPVQEQRQFLQVFPRMIFPGVLLPCLPMCLHGRTRGTGVFLPRVTKNHRSRRGPMSSISVDMNNISMLNGTNSKKWTEYAANKQVETSIILNRLISMRYNGNRDIREFINEMSNLVTRLRALKLELSEDILVHLVLISLPTQFNPFRISYITQKEKWTLNELIAQCMLEEERLKRKKTESTNLTMTFQNKTSSKKQKNNKDKRIADLGISQSREQKKQDLVFACYFCNEAGHMKKECSKYTNWREKKGLHKEPRC